jgi:hypothetical protein
VIFESRDPQAAPLRDLALDRLQFVMRRLRMLVAHARLRLSDVNGPRGGVDKHCQVELKTNTGATVVISSRPGPVICHAYMQAVGCVNEHLLSCFRHAQVLKLARTQRLLP